MFVFLKDFMPEMRRRTLKFFVSRSVLHNTHLGLSTPVHLTANINIKTVRTLAVCSDISDGWREERTGGVQHHLATYWIRMWILAQQSHIRLYQIHERRLGDGEVLRAALIAQEIFSFNSTESCNEHTNCEAPLTGRRVIFSSLRVISTGSRNVTGNVGQAGRVQ